ncbi:hypothetical protein [Bosea sp. RAC05]|uniref:hypothetical protein n=1 Tax=Bosea sp. RAC05 TaxID=1842539 RepID=UPI00083CBA52|nr:hypothetical protein [Bosea sp. RAC05]AOG03394.1 hypothetical protein BSY19_4740 [Bosea sp. RAC05]
MSASDDSEGPRLHGLLPLVRDDQSAVGIRFGLPGDEAEPIRTVAELPDVSLVLRVFDYATEMRGWQAASRTHIGNAVAYSDAPAELGLSFCIEARFDIPSMPGDDIDATIPAIDGLTGKPVTAETIEKLRLSCSSSVGKHVTAVADRKARQATKDFWAPELAVMKGPKIHAHLSPFDQDVKALKFELATRSYHHRWEGIVEKGEAGATVTIWPVVMPRFDQDIQDAWRDLVRSAGWDPDERVMKRRFAEIGQEQADIIVAAAESLEVPRRQLQERQSAREDVAKVLVDRDLVRVTTRMLRGCPVVCGISGDPASQWNTRSRRSSVVAGSRVREAVRAGVIVPVWWQPRWKVVDRITMNSIETIVFALTETGAAIARNDLEAAARTIKRDAEVGRWWLGTLHGKDDWAPEPDPSEFARFVPEELLVETASAIDLALETERFPRKLSESGSLAFAAACVATGRAQVSDRAIVPQIANAPRP